MRLRQTRRNVFLCFSHIRVDLLSHDSKATDKQEHYNWRAGKKLDGEVSKAQSHRGRPSNFFLRSNRNRVDLLSYERKPTDKREQYDKMAENYLNGRL